MQIRIRPPVIGFDRVAGEIVEFPLVVERGCSVFLSPKAVGRQVADPGTGEGARWAQMRTHRIATDMLAELGASSKLNAEWEFVTLLRDEGRRAAEAFLKDHGDDLGKRSSADIDVLLAES